jgi:hypothetical protein
MIKSKNPIISNLNCNINNYITIMLTIPHFTILLSSYSLNLHFFSTFVPGKSFTTSSL